MGGIVRYPGPEVMLAVALCVTFSTMGSKLYHGGEYIFDHGIENVKFILTLNSIPSLF